MKKQDKIINTISSLLVLDFDGMSSLYYLLILFGIYLICVVFYNRYWPLLIVAAIIICTSLFLLVKRYKKISKIVETELGDDKK